MAKSKTNTKTILISILLLLSGIGLWLTLSFFSYQLLKNLQITIYQQTGEILYSNQPLAIGIFISIFFIPLAIYCLISKFFFPQYWTRVITKSSRQFSKKGVELLDKLTIVFAMIGITVCFFYFHNYLALGKDYLAFSRPGLIHKRNYFSYSKIQITKKHWERGSVEYAFFLDGKKIKTSFMNETDLIKDIQIRQKEINLKISQPENIPSFARGVKGSIARIIAMIIMSGGLIALLNSLRKNRRK